jgi:hypothetical protein
MHISSFQSHSAALEAWETLGAKGYINITFNLGADYPSSDELNHCTRCGNGNVM